MHEILVNRLGGLSLPRKSVVRLTDRPDMTLDVHCGRKTTIQQQQQFIGYLHWSQWHSGSHDGLSILRMCFGVQIPVFFYFIFFFFIFFFHYFYYSANSTLMSHSGSPTFFTPYDALRFDYLQNLTVFQVFKIFHIDCLVRV